MNAQTRRSLLAALPAATLSPVLPPAACASAQTSALTAYDAVMARRGKARSDEAIDAWCEEEEAALFALAAGPPGSLADLLRMVVLLGDRVEDDAGWNLMACEEALLLAVRDQARVLLSAGIT